MSGIEKYPGEAEYNRRWLASFTPVPESQLTDLQRQMLKELRESFPKMQAGRARGEFHAFILDAELGPVSISLGAAPRDHDATSSG